MTDKDKGDYPEQVECKKCDGTGWVEFATPEGQDEYECPDCHGTGFVDKVEPGVIEL